MKKTTDYICPKCGKDMNISMEDYEVDADCLSVKMYCYDCDTSWREYFLLKYDGYACEGHFYDANGEQCDL